MNCSMRQFLWCALALLAALPAAVRADDFEIAISVAMGDKTLESKETQASALTEPMPERPVFRAAAGERLQVAWRATNTSRAAELADVLVHFFVVEQEQAGQAKVPPLGAEANVRHEGALSMDFKPSEKAAGRFSLTIDKPGAYLVRVETVGTAESHGHEHYTAMDLIVE